MKHVQSLIFLSAVFFYQTSLVSQPLKKETMRLQCINGHSADQQLT
jgi:hypothetical protein